MSNASRKRRAQKSRRRQVDRTERVLPPPEAAQHHRAWPMQLLLAAGPEHGGIDSDEFEAALQIVETYRALTQGLGMVAQSIELEKIAANYSGAMSERDADRCSLWFDWSMHLPRGLPARLVSWIEDEQPIASVVVLRRACHLWDATRRRRAKESCPLPVDTSARAMRLTVAGYVSYGDAPARPVNLPAQPFRNSPVSPAIECRSCPAAGQDHRPSVRPKR